MKLISVVSIFKANLSFTFLFIFVLSFLFVFSLFFFFFFQAEDGIRDAQESRGLGDVYKRQYQRRVRGAVPLSTPTSQVPLHATPSLPRPSTPSSLTPLGLSSLASSYWRRCSR
eukprot:TRINITY_DN36317_c0_g1_i1.p1 TRINITY_DN36317_c0_g1~~TRINITY_DN36317_c0_g1_i1.p1  ORF type:complete len:114 (-),score=15.31 TRINITY_DN36317_c0_g1_i1:443-784(-)